MLAAAMQDEQQAPSEKQGKKRGGRGGAGGSVDALAESAVRKLSSIDPPLQLAGQNLQFQAQREMVSPSWPVPAPLQEPCGTQQTFSPSS